MQNETIRCKNCNEIFKGNFCNNCGQKSSIDKITYKYVQNELFDKFSPIDRGLIFTIRQLIKNPGKAIKNYVEGKRVDFIKPISFLLIITGLHLILVHYNKKEPLIINFISGLTSALEKENSITDKNPSIIIFKWLINNYAYTSLLLIPFFSICSFVAFQKSNKNYFENLVLNTYTLATITLFTIVLYPLPYFGVSYEQFEYIQFILLLIISFWTYYSFFDVLKKSSIIINTILTFILFFIIVNFIIMFFVIAALIF